MDSRDGDGDSGDVRKPFYIVYMAPEIFFLAHLHVRSISVHDPIMAGWLATESTQGVTLFPATLKKHLEIQGGSNVKKWPRFFFQDISQEIYF